MILSASLTPIFAGSATRSIGIPAFACYASRSMIAALCSCNATNHPSVSCCSDSPSQRHQFNKPDPMLLLPARDTASLHEDGIQNHHRSQFCLLTFACLAIPTSQIKIRYLPSSSASSFLSHKWIDSSNTSRNLPTYPSYRELQTNRTIPSTVSTSAKMVRV